MAGTGERYALGRLVLEYIRTFMWPLVIVVVLLLYWQDVYQLVQTRKVSIGGLEIGDAVQQVESATAQQLADLKLFVQGLEDSYRGQLEAVRAGTPAVDAAAAAEPGELVREIETKIASIQRNLAGELRQLQRPQQNAAQSAPPQAQQQPAPTPGRGERSAALERAGFEAVLARDLDAAIARFAEAAEVWPDYHNVAELKRYLGTVKAAGPPDAAAWRQVDRTILTRYSWKMPPEIHQRFREHVAAAGGKG